MILLEEVAKLLKGPLSLQAMASREKSGGFVEAPVLHRYFARDEADRHALQGQDTGLLKDQEDDSNQDSQGDIVVGQGGNLASGRVPNEAADPTRQLWTMLQNAKSGRLDVLADLEGQKVDIDNRDHHGCTPLMHAARGGHLRLVKFLLERKARVDLSDQYQWTALMNAARNGHVDVAETLIAAKADISHKDRYSVTALVCAADRAHAPMVKLLLAQRADGNAKTKFGDTALSLASRKGHTDIVRVLLETEVIGQRPAPINLDETCGKHARTALVEAAMKGHYGIISLLIKHGASIQVPDKEGKMVTNFECGGRLAAAIQDGFELRLQKLKEQWDLMLGDDGVFPTDFLSFSVPFQSFTPLSPSRPAGASSAPFSSFAASNSCDITRVKEKSAKTNGAVPSDSLLSFFDSSTVATNLSSPLVPPITSFPENPVIDFYTTNSSFDSYANTGPAISRTPLSDFVAASSDNAFVSNYHSSDNERKYQEYQK